MKVKVEFDLDLDNISESEARRIFEAEFEPAKDYFTDIMVEDWEIFINSWKFTE